nr:hypothetical protein [Anaerolineaceae bacterium]
IATNLAAIQAKKGGDVLLLDTDPQGSATLWSRTRDESKIEPSVYCAQKFGRVDTELRKLSNKFDHIIIDAGGRDSEELRSSMLVADRVYIPLQSSQFDVWTISQMATMVSQASMLNPGMKAYIFLNRASSNPSVTETEEAREILGDLDSLILSQVIIHDRIAYRKAARDGMAVTEMKNPDQKAIAEINLLYKEIYYG